jgi:diguanylate cyclase (GGDEF)-like protein
MHVLITAIILSATLVFGLPASAEPLDISQQNHQPIGEHSFVLKEGKIPLTLDTALQAFSSGRFTKSNEAFLSFGIGSKPVWVALEVDNPLPSPITRRLSIENAWLDRIDVYFLREGRPQSRYQTGDALPFSERPIDSRFFLFDHSFPPGLTTILIRAETPDPMVLPIYLSSAEQTNTSQLLNGYSYGFLYGGLFVLLAYNLMLFFSLKSYRYLYYAFYLTAFLITNIAYTGHGFMWLWPDSPRWQLWSNPVLMMLFAISGLLFATLFLNTRTTFPRIHRGIMLGIIGFASLLALAVAMGSQVSALLLAFFFIFVFSVVMVFLGVISLRAGNKSAKYFLAASVTHVSASSITALVVWGLIPYSVLAFRAVDIGMTIDAVLLAMALADQFRINREAKLQAEKLAGVDPLTGINNRRAFYDTVNPIWNTGLRHDHDMSVILMDIDKFKSINDNYGHTQGDAVLTQLAATLHDEIRSGDILARWGGEEFIVFLPETNRHDALSLADRFRQQIATLRPQINDHNISLTVSMGVAHRDTADITLDQLISNADRQLYSAKELGRNRVC